MSLLTRAAMRVVEVLRSIVTQLGGSLEVAAVFHDRRLLLQVAEA